MSHGKKGLKKMAAHVGPNMTPMVDIVMYILIFFMLGSTFARPEWYLTSNQPAIDKADAKAAAQKSGNGGPGTEMPKDKVTITLKRVGDRTNAYAFDTSTDDLQGQFAELLVAKKKDLTDDTQVIIMPDRDVVYEDVITVYDNCMRARFAHVAFATAQ